MNLLIQFICNRFEIMLDFSKQKLIVCAWCLV